MQIRKVFQAVVDDDIVSNVSVTCNARGAYNAPRLAGKDREKKGGKGQKRKGRERMDHRPSPVPGSASGRYVHVLLCRVCRWHC